MIKELLKDIWQWRQDVSNLRDLAIEEKNEKIENACFDILMFHNIVPQPKDFAE